MKTRHKNTANSDGAGCLLPFHERLSSISQPIAQPTKWLAGFALSALIATTASAQTAADPGLSNEIAAQEHLREREREKILREQQTSSPDIRLKRATTSDDTPIPTDETPCFPINQIQLQDPTGQFQWALTEANQPDVATGRCLGSRGINLVMKRIQNAIIDRGYITTRVLAEAQDMTQGTLRLTLIPGRIRQIRFTDDSDQRANAWNAFPGAQATCSTSATLNKD